MHTKKSLQGECPPAGGLINCAVCNSRMSHINYLNLGLHFTDFIFVLGYFTTD